MLQRTPRTYYDIVRIIPDPSDTTTYFVRAKVRNSRTGALISTLTLTQDPLFTRRYYYAAYQLPADPSGQGVFIDITTSVYTDAGFTTASLNYLDYMEQILVMQQWSLALGGGASGSMELGGSDVDYKKIEKLIAKALKPILAAQEVEKGDEPAEFSKPDLTPILEALGASHGLILKAIDALPAPKQVNFKPVIDHINTTAELLNFALNRSISEMPRPVESTPTDLTPVLEKLETLATPEHVETAAADLKTHITGETNKPRTVQVRLSDDLEKPPVKSPADEVVSTEKKPVQSAKRLVRTMGGVYREETRIGPSN